MKALISAGLSAFWVCFTVFLGISSGQAGPALSAVISPLAASKSLESAAPMAAGYGKSDSAGNPTDPVHAVGVGSTHSCAIKADGRLVCWGENVFGAASPPKGR
ncbi:RCC1-like domain-containing protein [Methylococcus mesophilus]|uniref:RCC1-like domain-containing protein n=1 Tax=Methylococcus mesophilus TaxID=2993564 RepID=UPI00224AA128|nr:RCC1 domain-containing protein [Methylococcus mesophilus]UZR27517.1 RCC1 domain-containing protein [Methylococcus mesophilus]